MSDAFAAWLRSALRIRRVSQRQLSQISGVDHSTISRLLRGERTPRLRTAERLRDALAAVPAQTGARRTPLVAMRDVRRALAKDRVLRPEDVREVFRVYLSERRAATGPREGE